MITRRLTINLTDEEEKFIQWMAKRDNVSYRQELMTFFQSDLDRCMELYKDEMLMEEGE